MILLLLGHVTIALTSLVYTTYAYFNASKNKLRVAYGMVGATLVSGTWLVISTHSNMLHSCETGLIYLGIVSAGLLSVRHKLPKEDIKNI